MFTLPMNKFIYSLLVVLTLVSCSEYQSALKSEDVALKLKVATAKYEAGKYAKAIRLMEQIAPAYRGKPNAEDLFYMFAQSYYKTKQYYLSGYQFESFVSLYPRSVRAEEAAFLGAKSYSELSPEYSLDQTDTEKAITKMQDFINKYPDSKFLAEANTVTKVLQQKLELKAFEIAKQYNTVEDYKASIKALDNFLGDYPGSIYKENALFYKLDSNYKLAINSVTSKMEERLLDARTAYNALVKYKADTQYKKVADEMLVRIEKDLQQFQK